jgi:hypothetical protein
MASYFKFFFFILILIILKELIPPFLISSLVNFCSATVTSKKDRGKGKLVNPPVNEPLAIKPESALIGTPVVSPFTTSLALTNRFMTFNPEPNVTFNSALATDYNPFLGSPQRPRMSFVKAKKPSSYVRLPYFQHLFFVEIGMTPIKEPSQLALAYFPPRFHWVPKHPLKDISYYTNILVETKLLGLKAISKLNMLLKLLNKPFLFLLGMKILNFLVRDLLIILLLKALSFCILELSKFLLNHKQDLVLMLVF